MMMKILPILFILLLSSLIHAQTQFENASFEEWEPIEYGSIPEPVDWSTVRSATPDELAQVAPGVWDQSEDAHTGMYSLYLINKAAFGLVATGMVTSGRVLADLDYDKTNSHTEPDDSRWHMRLPHRPDSIVGWYKAKPKPGDFPTMKVLMHVGYASLPQQDSTNWIGVAYAELSGTEVSTWTRFSAPFEYFDDRTPEFMLTIITAGNGTEAIDGSEAWFDDVQLIYNDGTSIDELAPEDLKVFASNGNLNVFIEGPEREEGLLMVTDVSGRRLLSSEITTGSSQQFRLDVREGVYLVTVQVDGQRVTKKVFMR
jgi:hypothetical protein